MSHPKTSPHRIVIAAMAFLSLTTMTREARAACGSFEQPKASSKLTPSSSGFAAIHPVSLAFAADGQRETDGDPSIVGLWKIAFKVFPPGVPDGIVVDAGYATWHSDGTELMNSGRPPLTSSFCMGVWQQDGRRTYRLNHVALSWDPSGTVFVGPAQIRETVTVSREGRSYSGTFTIDQFDTVGNTVMHAEGRVTGERITVD